MEGNNAELNVAVQPPEVVEVAPVKSIIEEFKDIIEKVENTIAGIKENETDDLTLIEQNIDIANASALELNELVPKIKEAITRRHGKIHELTELMKASKKNPIGLELWDDIEKQLAAAESDSAATLECFSRIRKQSFEIAVYLMSAQKKMEDLRLITEDDNEASSVTDNNEADDSTNEEPSDTV